VDKIKAPKKAGKIFVLSGPSGSGKTTLLEGLVKSRTLFGLLDKSCSVTTRSRRRGEKEGKDYFFVSKKEFNRLQKTKKILEWTNYLGYYYGTPKGPLESKLNEGKSIGLCLDLKGANTLKKLYPDKTVTIFILPPSLDELKTRIEKRSRENKKETRQRLRIAGKEILAAADFDYCILNKNLKVALGELKDIFFKEINKSEG